MSKGILEHFKLWFEYEKDAHLKTIHSLISIPDEKRKTRDFQKATDLFAHIVGARLLWLNRMGILENLQVNLFPDNVKAEELNSMAEGMHKVWDDYFDKLDKNELERVFEYKSTEKLWYTNKVEEILTQLFGHSLYHRGQIAQLIRNLKENPAETDFVYWSRKPVSAKD